MGKIAVNLFMERAIVAFIVTEACWRARAAEMNHMNTFLVTLAVFLVVIAAMSLGVLFGRKPIAGSCGGLGAMGKECEFGCKKPCSKRLVRIDQEASADR